MAANTAHILARIPALGNRSRSEYPTIVKNVEIMPTDQPEKDRLSRVRLESLLNIAIPLPIHHNLNVYTPGLVFVFTMNFSSFKQVVMRLFCIGI